jgi:dolichol-phosphate mannosyltransferase
MTDLLASHPDADAAISARFDPPELAVVVPSFNERENVGLLYDKLAVTLAGLSWEMIVVDDNSPDGTAELVKQLGRRHPNLRCIKRVGRRGLSSACIEGVLATSAPYVAVMDADLQHDEAILPQMLARAEAGADLVIGSRFTGSGSAAGGFSATRAWGSSVATRLSAVVAGQEVSDPMSGFFLMRRLEFERVVPALASDGFKILLDLIVTSRRQGRPLSIVEVPYTFRQRHAGESKMSAIVAIQFMGLFLSKLTGGVLPTSFLLFAMIGVTGIAVHLATLGLVTMVLG